MFDSGESLLEFDKLRALIELLGEDRDLQFFPCGPYGVFWFHFVLFPSSHGAGIAYLRYRSSSDVWNDDDGDSE